MDDGPQEHGEDVMDGMDISKSGNELQDSDDDTAAEEEPRQWAPRGANRVGATSGGILDQLSRQREEYHHKLWEVQAEFDQKLDVLAKMITSGGDLNFTNGDVAEMEEQRDAWKSKAEELELKGNGHNARIAAMEKRHDERLKAQQNLFKAEAARSAEKDKEIRRQQTKIAQLGHDRFEAKKEVEMLREKDKERDAAAIREKMVRGLELSANEAREREEKGMLKASIMALEAEVNKLRNGFEVTRVSTRKSSLQLKRRNAKIEKDNFEARVRKAAEKIKMPKHEQVKLRQMKHKALRKARNKLREGTCWDDFGDPYESDEPARCELYESADTDQSDDEESEDDTYEEEESEDNDSVSSLRVSVSSPPRIRGPSLVGEIFRQNRETYGASSPSWNPARGPFAGHEPTSTRRTEYQGYQRRYGMQPGTLGKDYRARTPRDDVNEFLRSMCGNRGN